MTEDPNNNQANAVEPAELNNQEVINNSPAEDFQPSSPSLVDFSSSMDSNQTNGPAIAESQPENIDMLMDVNLQFTVELGRTQMPVRQILELQNGSVVELDRIAGEAVDVFINEHLMARGEVVVVDDKFGVRITELISPTKGK
jgi:flagellar motor switch protein FliN/FliY